MIRKPGQRVGSRHAAHLVEELRVVEQRPAQHHHVAQHHERMRHSVRRVQHPLGLTHGDVADHIQRRCEEKCPVERCARAPQPPPVTNRRRDVQSRRQQIPRPRHEHSRMNFRRPREHEIEDTRQIRHRAHDQRNARDFLRRIARHRNPPLHHQRRQQQHAQQCPPGQPSERNLHPRVRGNQHPAIKRHAARRFD